MASARDRKPQLRNKQPAVDRLLRHVINFRKANRFPRVINRDTKGRFVKTSRAAAQKRDKYGRFAKANQLGLAKRQPPRLRDQNGRFISRSVATSIRRDKRGRFTKASPPWHRRRAVMALPVILGIVGAIYFGLQLNKPIIINEPLAVSQKKEKILAEVANAKVSLPKSEPTRLRIPKIAVDTSFISITKMPDGTVEVPSRHDAVGWYDKAPTPGELGPAVVVGHVDRPGGPAVFWRLREMLPGDVFEIDRADGTTVKFQVTEVKQVPQDAFPTEEVYGNLDHAGIRLITCGGTFNRTIRKYSHNTVVYGSMIVEEKVSTTQ